MLNQSDFIFETLLRYCHDFEAKRSSKITFAENVAQRDLAKAASFFCQSLCPDTIPWEISCCIAVTIKSLYFGYIALVDRLIRDLPDRQSDLIPLIPVLFRELPSSRVVDAATIISDWANADLLPKSVTGPILDALRPALVPMAASLAAARRRASAAAPPSHLVSTAPTFFNDPCVFAFDGPLSLNAQQIAAVYGVGRGAICPTCGRTFDHLPAHAPGCAAAAADEAAAAVAERVVNENSIGRLSNEHLYLRAPYVGVHAEVGDAGWQSVANVTALRQAAHAASQQQQQTNISSRAQATGVIVSADVMPMCCRCAGPFRTRPVDSHGVTRYALIVRAGLLRHPHSPFHPGAYPRSPADVPARTRTHSLSPSHPDPRPLRAPEAPSFRSPASPPPTSEQPPDARRPPGGPCGLPRGDQCARSIAAVLRRGPPTFPQQVFGLR